MQSKVEVRSVLFGVLLGVLLMASFGAVANPAGAPGRFVIETNEAHAFVLDTATGQVWEKFTPSSQGQTDNEFARPKLHPALK